MLIKSATAIAFVMAMTTVPAAFAAQSEQPETAALSGTTVTVADAVAAVEAKGQGKVVELTLAGSATAPVYNVTAQMPDGTENNFTVDAKTGKVATSTDVADNQASTEPEDGNGSDAGETGEGAN